MTINQLLAGFLAISVLILISSCKTLSVPKYTGKASDHYNGKKFFNPPPFEFGSFKELRKARKAKEKVKWYYTQPELVYTPNDYAPEGEILFTHINHSTVLIQMDSLNILTDPIFSKRASPFNWAGPKRYRGSGISIDKLPPIDYILISHDHYDHLDINSLIELDKKYQPRILVGLGLKAFLKKYNLTNVVELDWDDWKTDLDTKVKFHFKRAIHWSNRGLNPNRSLWGSFLIEGSGNIYFAGDTAYGDHFKALKDEFGHINLALIPIGAYIPRSFMRRIHMDPQDAYNCFMDLQPDMAMGIHWGTFQLADEGMFDPKLELYTLMAEVPSRKINADRFICDEEPGVSHVLKLEKK